MNRRSHNTGHLQQALRSATVALDLDACDALVAGKPYRNEASVCIGRNTQYDDCDGSLAILACETQALDPEAAARRRSSRTRTSPSRQSPSFAGSTTSRISGMTTLALFQS